MAKDKQYNRMIHNSRWLKLKRAKITANPECERCAEEGRPAVPATEIHHIKPVEDGLTPSERERLMYDFHNLRSLCHDCHIKTHVELGRSGKAHAKRKTKEQLESFRKKFLT